MTGVRGVLQALLALTLGAVGARGQAPGAIDTTALPPAGFGSLRQEDVAVRLQTANLQLRVLPLDERVIRLLSPDAYESLRRLLASKTDEIAEAASRSGAGRPTLVLVSFYGLRDRAEFNPEDVTLNSQNQLFRPAAILPLSPLWGGLQLNQRESATAIYVFESGVAVLDPFTVSYGSATSDQWERTRQALDQERTRVAARAAAARRGTP